MQAKARWWRRWVNIFIGLVNGQVLLQISLRSGRSCLLVRDSLPSLSPLCVAYHQIPLSGVQASNFLAASSFFSISALLCQVWLKMRNAHQEIRLQGSYQKKAKKSRDRITSRANMVDVRDVSYWGGDWLPGGPLWFHFLIFQFRIDFHFLGRDECGNHFKTVPVLLSMWSGPDGWNMLCRRIKFEIWGFVLVCREGLRK